MKVFVAGASGPIGRPWLPRLLGAGHEVAGMTRSREKAKRIAGLGALPVVCDVYDRERLAESLNASGSDVVVHLLTDLPVRFKPRASTESTNRIRREGTANLLEAARAAGACHFIAQSIAFLYAPAEAGLKREEDPPWIDAPGSFAETVRALLDLEQQVLASSMNAVVLRFGWLYGPGTWYAPDGGIGRDVRRRMYPIVGAGSGTWSFLHVADAAHAVIAAVERAQPGVYNVVDDDPAAIHTWLPAFAEAIGAPAPFRIPRWLGHGRRPGRRRVSGGTAGRRQRQGKVSPQLETQIPELA